MCLHRGPGIDVHVVDHCNLRCRGCVHFAPIAEPRFLDLDAYEQDLAAFAAIPGIEDIDNMRRRAHPMCRYCATSLNERIEWRRSTLDRYEWLMRPDERK